MTAILRNWITDASIKIVEMVQKLDHHDALLVTDIYDVIESHSPMRDGVLYMRVPRCETCKHWVAEETPFGLCQLLMHGNYARDLAISRLAVADSHGNDAVLITRDSFGCVQWEAK